MIQLDRKAKKCFLFQIGHLNRNCTCSMKKGRGRTSRIRRRKLFRSSESRGVNESYKPEFIELKKWLKERKFEDMNLTPARFPGTVWLSTLTTFLTWKTCGHRCQESGGDSCRWAVSSLGAIFYCASTFLPWTCNTYLYFALFQKWIKVACGDKFQNGEIKWKIQKRK